MKFLIGQINTTPCDFQGNLQKIQGQLVVAKTNKCQLAVFPELSIPGYLSQDLMFDHDFVERNLAGVERIQDFSKECPDLRIIVGCVGRNTKGVGKPFWNMALMIHNGYVKCQYVKQLLPFYDVFDEGRYFEPGQDTTVFEIDGVKFGLTICEDLWNDKEQEEANYLSNPVEEYRKLNVDCLINISSSPYSKSKPLMRQRMIEDIASSFPKGIIYVNQIGGQDELVFDGGSTYVQTKGSKYMGYDKEVRVREVMPYNYSDKGVFELDPAINWIARSDLLEHSCQYMKDMLVLGLKDYITKSGFKSIVLGSSGGIDSALVACLAAEAIGPENVHCIMMPSIYSSDHSLTDAKELHANMGCNEYKIPIAHEQVVRDLAMELLGQDGIDGQGKNSVADENIQARIRGSYVMWFSNAYGALTLTTGNKSELAIGYATLYGDMCGGYAPICDLYKMEVYEIAKQCYSKWIPKNIIDKKPSAELAEGQFDDNELLPYPILDKVIEFYIEENVHIYKDFLDRCMSDFIKLGIPSKEDPDTKITLPEDEYNKVIRRIDLNEYKRRQYAPGTKISRKSFGIGRRIPIVKGAKGQ